MLISAFEWDDHNVGHIARHGFTPDEVEEIFASDYRLKRARLGRYSAFGETLDGRLGFVVFEKMPRGTIRVITARDMTSRERRQFRRK